MSDDRTNQLDDAAFFARVSKLLNLADQTKNNSEHEAALAMEKVQAMIQERGMTLAEVEAAGGKADDGGREKRLDGRFGAMYGYQIRLMTAIAEGNFCLHRVRRYHEARRKQNVRRHQLVGRRVNVEASYQMYEYLQEAMRRIAAEQGFDTKAGITKEYHAWFSGCANRLAQRVAAKARQAREEDRRRKQAEEARRAAADGGGRALVLLSDVYGTEEDLNNDYECGYPPGTTATRRKEYEAEVAAQAAKEKELVAGGMNPREAWYVAHGWGAEEAKAAAGAEEKQSKRRSRARSSSRGYRGKGWTRADQKHYEMVNSSAYKMGSSAGQEIGLDPQAGSTKTKRIK